jgi:hypothetical protein
MSDSPSREVSPALEKAYQFLVWLIPTLDKFPRRQKFLLGDRIESTALDVLEGLVEATYTRNRCRLLEPVSNSSFPRKRRAVRGNYLCNGDWPRAHRDLSEVVLRGLDPRIHVFVSDARRRGWPGQARPRRN